MIGKSWFHGFPPTYTSTQNTNVFTHTHDVYVHSCVFDGEVLQYLLKGDEERKAEAFVNCHSVSDNVHVSENNKFVLPLTVVELAFNKSSTQDTHVHMFTYNRLYIVSVCVIGLHYKVLIVGSGIKL